MQNHRNEALESHGIFFDPVYLQMRLPCQRDIRTLTLGAGVSRHASTGRKRE